MREPEKPSNFNESSPPTISVRGVSRSFATAAGEFYALRNVSLEVRPGRLAAIVGGSGSGKSTLLNLITGIDRPSAGEVHVAGVRVDALGEDALATFRARHVGIVFQFFQLLPTLTALENVMLPMQFAVTIPKAERSRRASELLERVGVGAQASRFPDALSGGQQQRVAIARALANDPPLVVADEPTGNLDSQTAREVMALFAGLAESGKTVLVVTHAREHGSLFSELFELRDGRFVDRADAAHPRQEALACSG